MRIVFDQVEPEARAVFEAALTGHELVFLDTAADKATPDVLRDAEVLSIFVSSRTTAEMLANMPKLKLIVARSMGYDHIDVAAAQGKGIAVSTVPTYGVRTVAEFAFALILALSRKAYAAYDRLKQEGTTDVKHFEGFDLAGKTIGIVGTGNIGKNMVKIAKGFDMKVIASDARQDDAFAKEQGFEYKPLEALVAESDIVSLHVPYLPATHHLINAEILAKFKKGSYLINTARGAVVDTKALVLALKSEQLGGAGLDVVEGERTLFDELSLLSDEHQDINEFQQLVAAHMLLDMPNVVLTPHIAFNSKEAKKEINEVAAKNITSFIAGTPQNILKS